MERIDWYIDELKAVYDRLAHEKIDQIITILHEARLNGRCIYVMGNAGSAAIASHFALGLSKNTRLHGWPGYKIVSLVDNISALMAYASEQGFQYSFVAQLENILQRSDIVIGFCAGGDNQNIIKAFEFANKKGATTIAFTSIDNGRIGAIVDVNVKVQCDVQDIVEDIQFILGHLITKILREDATQVNVSKQIEILFPGALNSTNQAIERNDSVIVPIEANRGHSSTEIFNALSHELALEINPRDLLQRILKLMLEKMQASSGSIVIVNENGQVVEGILAYNGEIQIQSPQRFGDIIEKGLAGWVVHNRKAALVLNTRDDPRWYRSNWEDDRKSRSAVSVPLVENDKIVGALTLVNVQAGRFTDADVSLLAAVAVFLSLINYPV